MEYSATQIQALVREMDHSKKRWRHIKKRDPEQYRARMASENPKLEKDFPAIFDKHLEDGLDETFFQMLQLKRRIEKGEITNEQASAAMGQQLFGRYVKPVVDPKAPKPETPMSYEEYYNKFG